jgi:hypothetical protein
MNLGAVADFNSIDRSSSALHSVSQYGETIFEKSVDTFCRYLDISDYKIRIENTRFAVGPEIALYWGCMG